MKSVWNLTVGRFWDQKQGNADMSNSDTPVETGGMRQDSTQPSSPAGESVPEKMEVEEENTEEMDAQAKALMHLLSTSEVFVAIMADKMKKQQEEAKLEAAKQREQKSAEAMTKKKPTAEPVGKRATRTSARQSAAKEPVAEEEAKTEEQGVAKSKRGRGRKAAAPAAAAKSNTISSYFKKADVQVPEDNPTIQEALEHAADEYEANPSVLGGQDLVATQQPELITGGQMKKYQLEGLEWLKSLWMNGLCGILADEMGLGKTVQAISLLAFFKEKKISGPFLIAAPLSTVSNWVDEFARWTPSIKTVLLLITGTPLQNNITELWSLLHFLLPEIFNDLDSFQSWFDFSSMLDSSDKTNVIERRKRTLVSTMHSILKPFLLRRVKTDVEMSLPKKREYILYAPLTAEQKDLYREILNGTGRQYLEIRARERLMAKNERLTRSGSVKRRVDSSGDTTPNKSLKSSRSSTPASTTSTTRRRKGPQSYKEISDREFNSKLRKLEQGIEDDLDIEGPSETEQEEIERAKTFKLAKQEVAQKKMQNPVMQARLACNSPHNFYWPWNDEPVDESLITASGKMLLLDRLVTRLLANGHKILIFSQFKSQLDILQDWATQLRSWNCCRIDGAISQTDRRDQIKAFNTDPDYKIFLLSTRAGGQGINLMAADTVILFDSDWNPQQDLQAQDRAHRIGQTRPVIVYRLATKGTVEQTLLEKADSKRRLERLVIQKGKFKSLLDPTSQDDVEDLRKALGEDEFERFEAGTDPSRLLSDKDLDILTDRSEEAYARAEKGLDHSGRAFLAVETKKDGLMAQITGKG
ncbi:unnamed protein product [Aspergillus oryzae]|uniref:Unnamed protein product n=2 Tax=Aspergillus oryzae TaxID=5062 RepID=A0AAN5BVS8_ASPOZ|nr:unnamed protein product [Aspergillus oryzae]GMF88045.1 unnamed protein product [Aspergillus oryzae]GMG28572.1 unnamed protein product [Aspergillus oryzae]GMG45711.1 unnamed protein product [Aspergillus oryzae var. brunneus]